MKKLRELPAIKKKKLEKLETLKKGHIVTIIVNFM